MSWDILPKSILQYFLQKLKDKFDLKADKEEVEEVDTSNSIPFLYRQTPYEADGVFLDELVGGSVAFNQLVQNGNFADTSGWQVRNSSTISFNSGFCTITPGSANSLNVVSVPSPVKYRVGNKILVNVNVKSSASIRITMQNNVVRFSKYSSASGNWENVCGIYSSVENEETLCFTNVTDVSAYDIKNVYVCDLTQMFGTTIADYIYSLEQATAGSGIAWLKSYGFFTKDYYPYNTGELISVKTSVKKYIGFNQWDEISEDGYWDVSTGEFVTQQGTTGWKGCKNLIPCLPYEDYYLKCDTTVTASIGYVLFYDANGAYITYSTWRKNSAFRTLSNAHYMTFYMHRSYFAHEICINIYDRDKNGTYLPYEEHTYDISNIDLRGIPKLVNNELVYDGDTYDSNGDVTRKYGIVDLGTLNWANDGVFWFTSVLPRSLNQGSAISNVLQYGGFAPSDASTADPKKWYWSGVGYFEVYVPNASTAQDVKSAMSGVMLVYELATHTIETVVPYQNPQICDKDGTEEFIDNRTVPIPVGHNSRYADLPAIMDGDYLSYMARNFASEEYVDTELDTKVDKVTGKGLSTNDYTNEEKALVESIPNKADADDVKGTQTVSGNPITLTDASETYAESLVVELEPKQDLHGYDFPWVGGAGKNKLDCTLTSQSIAGMTITVDSEKRVTINGKCTSQDYAYLSIGDVNFKANVTYRLTGCPSGTNCIIYSSAMPDGFGNPIVDYGNGGEKTTSSDYSDIQLYIRIPQNEQLNNVVFSPMFRVKTDGDDTFAPYSNICPITGYTQTSVSGCGKNLFNSDAMSNFTKSGDEYIGTTSAWRSALDNKEPYSGGFEENTRYTFSVKVKVNSSYNVAAGFIFLYTDGTESRIYFQGGNTYNTYTLTSTAGKTIDKITSPYNYYEDLTFKECQLEKADAQTTYESFASTSATIPFSNTLYGGVSDFVEGGTDDEFENLDDFTDVVFYANQGGTYAYEVYIGTPNKKNDIDNLIANEMPVKTSFTDVAEFSIRGFNNDSDVAIKFPKSIVNTPELAKQWCIDNGLQIVYEKATPTTIQTPPTELKLLKGTNNLSADGVMQIGYQPDNSIGDAVKASEEYTDRALDGIGDIVSKIEDTISYEETNTSFKAFKYKNGMKLLRINGDGFPKGVQGAVVVINGFLTKDYFPSIGNLNFIQGIGLDGGDNVRKVDITSSGSISIYGSTSDGIYIDFYYM